MIRTRVGYSGGTLAKPTYRNLGDHTECFEVDYDPARITFERLLEVFWAAHDPTASGGSTQYKAILFTHGEAQQRAARESKAALEKRLGVPVRTELRSAVTFWRAEGYHQKYALRGHERIARELRAQHASEQAFVDDPRVAKVNAWLAGAGDLAGLEAALPALRLSEPAQADLRAAATLVAGAGGACPR